jgi:hypothetical protein
MGSGLDDWIYWHFYTITVSYDSSQSMTVYDSLHSLPDYECLPFCVTDLVLIYESVTSSASVVRRLTLHSWTLNFWIILQINLLNLSLTSLTLRPTVSRSVCVGIKYPSGAYDQIFIRQTIAESLMWGAVSDDRTGLSFTIVAGIRQHSHSLVRLPWDSWPYFTVSDSTLPISSPPTTRRVTAEVFDPAFTRESIEFTNEPSFIIE